MGIQQRTAVLEIISLAYIDGGWAGWETKRRVAVTLVGVVVFVLEISGFDDAGRTWDKRSISGALMCAFDSLCSSSWASWEKRCEYFKEFWSTRWELEVENWFMESFLTSNEQHEKTWGTKEFHMGVERRISFEHASTKLPVLYGICANREGAIAQWKDKEVRALWYCKQRLQVHFFVRKFKTSMLITHTSPSLLSCFQTFLCFPLITTQG